VWITMLWPLADRPRLAPGQPSAVFLSQVDVASVV